MIIVTEGGGCDDDSGGGFDTEVSKWHEGLISNHQIFFSTFCVLLFLLCITLFLLGIPAPPSPFFYFFSLGLKSKLSS